MPRWPKDYSKSTQKICPKCGDKKDFYAITCRRCQPKPQGQSGKFKAAHPCWKGGEQIDRDGYLKTYHPEHPWPRKGGYIRENVRVMELHINRRLAPNETVHHKDENRLNNALENLEIKNRGEHSRHHRLRDTHKRKRIQGRFA